jgi:hypothetical protein
MVGVAQLVERRIVIPVVVGSIPIVHPIFSSLQVASNSNLTSVRLPFSSDDLEISYSRKQPSTVVQPYTQFMSDIFSPRFLKKGLVLNLSQTAEFH